MKKDHEINIDYIQSKFHKPHFEWCYKAIDYDLSRHFSYNIIALILHQIWIWICNQIYSDDKIQEANLDYINILKKWYRSATLDYINKVKNFKQASSKDSLTIYYIYNNNKNNQSTAIQLNVSIQN
ncbi:hypothetical protein ACTFIR_004844 [Dictyostelium discoideum]